MGGKRESEAGAWKAELSQLPTLRDRGRAGRVGRMIFFRGFVFILCGVVFLRAQTATETAPPARPIAAIEHVLIVSIDGLRPDRALLADMPVLRGLVREGAYTFWAKTTDMAVTLPSHTSMLTGVVPEKHGVVWNSDLPIGKPMWPRVPTLFELAGNAGYSTALIAGKSKFSALNKPGTVTYAAIADQPKSGNAEVVANAVRIITAHRPTLVFVHFPDVDSAGHKFGWGSAEQLAMIEENDRQLGEVLAALSAAGIREKTAIFVTADHGGAGKNHGPLDPRSAHIPWVLNGPGIKRGFDLTGDALLSVRTEDTVATACFLLGLAPQPDSDGRVLGEAFAKVSR